jgi:hypothetical protein
MAPNISYVMERGYQVEILEKGALDTAFND